MTTDRDQELHDVLIKAGEDVQQGMWCMGSWFSEQADWRLSDDGLSWAPEEVFTLQLTVEKLSKLHRCAEGSIALATITAGLPLSVYQQAVGAVDKNLDNHCDKCEAAHSSETVLHEHNDGHMEYMNPFEAGQHLSEIFRATADRIMQ